MGRSMDVIWLLVVCSLGVSFGFVLFAVLHVSRETANRRRREEHGLIFPADLERDTVTRF